MWTVRIALVAALGSVAGCSDASSATEPDAAIQHAGERDAAADGRGAREAATSEAGQARQPDASTPPSWSFEASTSTAELTQNDTSACGSAAAPCSEAWTGSHSVQYSSGSYSGTTATVNGFWDNAVSAGAQAPASPYGRVSKVPMSALLAGYEVPVWVETQNWWGNGGGHIDNGETSASAAQIANQVLDHVSRGIAGQIVDWYGPGTTADLALPFVLANAEATSGKYKFAVMIDKGYFEQHCGNTVACLNTALAYIASHYGSSPAYLKNASDQPLVFFFINQYYPTQYALLSASGIEYSNTSFVMYEPNGFPGDDVPNTSGAYAWVNPADSSALTSTTGTAGKFAWDSDFGFHDMTGFFDDAIKSQSSYIVSAAYKGFDDNLANWSGNRIIDQQCGMTWLQSFDHTGSFGGAGQMGSVNYLDLGKRLDIIMVDTWDDYEEGTEIETGIDNCLASLDVTLTNSTLSWSPSWGQDPMNSAVSGSEASLYKYSVYVAEPGGAQVMWLADVMCKDGTCGHSLDVSTYGIMGGPYVFYVQAVGQPSIVNTLAGPTSASYMNRG